MDWTATILAAGETQPAKGYPLDGIDLLPVLKGTTAPGERTFFWRIGTQDAVRQGKWKYFRDGGQRKLFDLSIDEHEQADFSATKRDVLERLSSEFAKWDKQMLPRLKRGES